jgi:hypothetical protein
LQKLVKKERLDMAGYRLHSMPLCLLLLSFPGTVILHSGTMPSTGSATGFHFCGLEYCRTSEYAVN